MKLWCLVGDVSGEVLTYKDKALVHKNKRELEYLFPGNRVVSLPDYWDKENVFALKDHPDMDAVQFPLDLHMDQFRNN